MDGLISTLLFHVHDLDDDDDGYDWRMGWDRLTIVLIDVDGARLGAMRAKNDCEHVLDVPSKKKENHIR